MTERQARNFADRLESQGYSAEIRDDYSGRCMYGRTTYAVVTDLHPADKRHVSRVQCRSDNMGLDYVYY